MLGVHRCLYCGGLMWPWPWARIGWYVRGDTTVWFHARCRP